MPRRRLHGETQKRRKKARTRLLKRAVTAVRVTATLQPAPFERTERIEREDLEFLEAMRELAVQRGPWRGESQARREAVERVQFLADDAEGKLFQRSMAHHGVKPLAGRELQGSSANDESPTETAAGASPAGQLQDAPPPAEPPPTEPSFKGTAGPEAPTPGAEASRQEPATRPAIDRTEFEAGTEARAMMEALLHGGNLDPELKFAGAEAPPRRGKAQRAPHDAEEAEPDDELDLHGKTLEEAIHMVQAFLQGCQRLRYRHVLIITGRGRNSGQHGPVLKEAVQRWLELNGKRFARDFVRAPGRLGGDGAIWITLR